MSRRHVTLCLLALALFGWGWGEPLEAQISPGPLSAPHAELEGSDRCLECHSQKKRVSAELCLDCHELLRSRIEQGHGYHVTVLEQGCERCHMEHHGRDFELVFWGDEGEAAFDHQQASFELQGAHADLTCRSCHKESLIGNKEPLLRQHKDLNRTFLGLDGSSCRACHADEHRSQFEGRGCEDCHGLVKWTEGSLFRHEDARFPLVGKHRQVACDRCHRRSIDGANGDPYTRYTSIPFAACTDCHRDPHAGRLGANCTQCHTEEGWQQVALADFDHERTRFSLVGAHRRANCSSCHPSGVASPPPSFDECSDCHVDHHQGQFAPRSGGGDCEACHNVESFGRPSFGIAEHQASGFPLLGSHLAVPCIACHTPLAVASTQNGRRAFSVPSPVTAGLAQRYTFASTVCSACHKNPHEPGIDRFMLEQDCQTCHRVESWRQIEFEHERTDYQLVGAHRRATCVACHQVSGANEASPSLQFDGRSQACLACHQDPHAGQFNESGSAQVCARCHSMESWKDLRFDHDRDSSFALVGAHRELECRSCHPTQSRGEQAVTLYRPLGRECRDCHSGVVTQRETPARD